MLLDDLYKFKHKQCSDLMNFKKNRREALLVELERKLDADVEIFVRKQGDELERKIKSHELKKVKVLGQLNVSISAESEY